MFLTGSSFSDMLSCRKVDVEKRYLHTHNFEEVSQIIKFSAKIITAI